jgi:hypothetical protein
MQFPSHERLEEIIQFLELKMKISRAKIMVVPWNAQTKAKAHLHTIWVSTTNVPKEMLNYQAVCELGLAIRVMEEVDLKSLETQGKVRFKVHMKSMSKIPLVILGSNSSCMMFSSILTQWKRRVGMWKV